MGQLTLTQTTKARALKAFKRLLGSSGQGEAKSDNARLKEIPDEGTKLGAILSRAQTRLAEEAARNQENREEVGRRAFEELSQSADDDASDAPIEDDWLNIFGRHAENASSEMLRDLWAKILAGEAVSYTHLTLPTTPYV